MKKLTLAFCSFVAVTITTAVVSAQTSLAVGESIGIDFASPSIVFGTTTTAAPAAGTNFNGFDIQTADTTTEAFVGDLIKLDGSTTTVGFSVANNSGKDSGLTGVDGSVGPAPFDDPSIALDNYGAANVGNAARPDGGTLAADGNFVFTFSGLDDSLSYEVTGGYLHSTPSDNFNTTWDIDGQSATTANTSGLPDAGYITLSDLSTDGSGNLEITVTRSVQLFVSGLTLTADTGGTLVGDVNLDGTVDFLDIGPFVSLLSSGGFLLEADIDGSGAVDFLDIGPFIGLLSN